MHPMVYAGIGIVVFMVCLVVGMVTTFAIWWRKNGHAVCPKCGCKFKPRFASLMFKNSVFSHYI